MNTNDNLQQPADGKNSDSNALENAMVEEANNQKQESAVPADHQDATDGEPVKPGSNKKDPVRNDDTSHEDAMVAESSAAQQEKEVVIVAAENETELEVEAVLVAAPATAAAEDETQTETKFATEVENDTAIKELTIITKTIVEDAVIPAITKPDDSDDGDHEEDRDKAIPEKDYNSLDMPSIIAELRHLMQEHPINSFRNQAEQLKKAFEVQEAAHEKEARDAFQETVEPNDDPLATAFEYKNPLAKEFYDLHALYRKQKGELQRQVRKQQEDNLEKKRVIIEGIKSLIDEEENIGTTFKKFNVLQDSWKTTGNIPHDSYNIVWEDYRLHVQNFYDYIDLSKELRDKDFERNLDFRNRIIERAQELGGEEDIHKALRELQELHRMWKEDAGPVTKEERDPIWDRFKDATKVIHDKRQTYYEERDKMAGTNQTIKQNIVAEIEKLTKEGATNHSGWQHKLTDINALKELFTQTGPAPKEVNNSLWDQFRTVTRAFNHVKNEYYKSLKDEQNSNLARKMNLITIAEEHKESEDYAGSLDVMKRIQREWKDIGHVPRKDSDKMWKRFQKACNAFFEKKTAQRKQDSTEEVVNFEAKMEIYDALKDMLPQDDLEAMKMAITALMDSWTAIGHVPHAKRQIQEKFEKLVKVKFKSAGLSETDAEMLKYQGKLDSLSDGNERDFKNERFYLVKRRDEIKKEKLQLENNLLFFNAKDDKNPLLVQQKKNIAALDKELDVIKEKQKQLNILERQLNKEDEQTAAAAGDSQE
jgi:hypothetical protein